MAPICENWDYNSQLNAPEQRFDLEFPTPKDLNSRTLARCKQLSGIYLVPLEKGGKKKRKGERKGEKKPWLHPSVETFSHLNLAEKKSQN